jgi:hypothetical protein
MSIFWIDSNFRRADALRGPVLWGRLGNADMTTGTVTSVGALVKAIGNYLRPTSSRDKTLRLRPISLKAARSTFQGVETA